MGSYFNSNQRKLVSALAAAIFLAICIVLGSAPMAFARYSGGTGKSNDPFRIASPEDLNDVGNHQDDWDKHFVLVNDVNLAQYAGTQFKIIGEYSSRPFKGIFDGNDHKIWNFTWASNDMDFIGMFRYLGPGGQIKNLGMENVNISAVNGECIGGLVGFGWVSDVTASFWDIQTSGYSTSAGGEPKTTAEMKTRSTFTDTGWDFVEIWCMGERQTYPFLRFAPVGDLNYDKVVDWLDFALLADHWLWAWPCLTAEERK